MNCLYITNNDKNADPTLVDYLKTNHVEFESTFSILEGLQRILRDHYDVVLLDATSKDKRIQQSIRLVKKSDPATKIIVQTDSNSKSLETLVRKEQIFYYHVNSTGHNFLKAAVCSGLGLKNCECN